DKLINVKGWLNSIGNQDAKLILFWIELYREFKDKDYKDRSVGLHYEYQLEHLMPQSWQKYWGDIADTEKDAEALIYQIGNMTLLKGKLNNEIKNREWLIKLNGDGKARNYISKNADLCINKELLKKEKWNKKEIEKRTQQFIDDFFQIWDINCFEA
ncbi:HNH endonuclease family protein, partial [Helicobacter sp.]|uniref:HNH endonuclease family protein n=1 Tax=Helicobacter sp. TaxID=218 RepID=UPI00199492A1